ncbi:JmjC domain-containing protein [Hydrogenovibrio kuenenii]|uniref:JmjC domain-containing protein n=1 Tax=Hydrogenovibrio kuenenii TaxID=63658 RepID=UPI0004671174|nr:cupin domain-containing protein [Hydrogenovibrio kuenenii]
MLNFGNITLDVFLKDYWQKKPLLIKNAFPNFVSPISAEELAGLSLEDEVESRIVIQKGNQDYELKSGPFDENFYGTLPEQNWTLLVQGMDRLIPDVGTLLEQFDFIPQWRLDDIMISYATTGGNVGPHFDHYDVFLLQAAGKRNWKLTSQDCELSNYIEGVDLRLMERFVVEDDYICETGDLLYVPPKWGHHGVSLTDDCMTWSIGYRTYKGLELWDSFGDYLAENNAFQTLYQDPNWQDSASGEITEGSWQQAKSLLQSALQDEDTLKRWFGRFATQLDQGAAQQLPEPLSEDEQSDIETLIDVLREAEGIVRDPVCRFAYLNEDRNVTLYINSAIWQDFDATPEFLQLLANQRRILQEDLTPHLDHAGNQKLLADLWQLQFFEILDAE